MFEFDRERVFGRVIISDIFGEMGGVFHHLAPIQLLDQPERHIGARRPAKKLQSLGNVGDYPSPPDCDLEQHHGLALAERYRGGTNSVRLIKPTVHCGERSKGEKVEARTFSCRI
jgi:hypothetical protein